MAAALFNWTGFYIGVQGGYGWGHSQVEVPSLVEWNHNGWFGGGLVGFNYQLQALVLGVEADWNFANIGGSVDVIPPPGGNLFSSKLNSFGSARGRIGFTGGQWLIFATAGYAWGSAEHTQHAFIVAVPPGTASATFRGWTAGGGIEFAFTPNLLGRIEYRHYWWDTANLVMPAPYTARTFNMSLDTVSVGLAWKM